MEILYKSIGELKYSQSGINLRLNIDQGIVDFYYSLIPKWFPIKRQAFKAHVSVVRKEIVPNMEFWERYDGEKIEFYYSPQIHNSHNYFWLNVFSVRLEEIRSELGLSIIDKYSTPPIGFQKVFHTTLGNLK